MKDDKYYAILGIGKHASADDVKKAYRKRAKDLHPDANKAEGAHENFILLNEAYEYLVNKLTGKVFNEQKGAFTSARTSAFRSHEEWARNQREYARRRAAAHAAMEVEKFKATRFYRNMELAEKALYYAQLGLVLAILFVIPVGATVLQGWKGFIGSVLIILITVHIWAPIVREFITGRKRK
jgi:curved DNA-binding protein CbpA